MHETLRPPAVKIFIKICSYFCKKVTSNRNLRMKTYAEPYSSVSEVLSFVFHAWMILISYEPVSSHEQPPNWSTTIIIYLRKVYLSKQQKEQVNR